MAFFAAICLSYKILQFGDTSSWALGAYMDIFQLPILFFVVFGVLIIVWGFLKKYHKTYLKGLLN